MLDTYLYGDVNRVSPEAPVPVVNINKKEIKLGGAGNVALNIKELGSTPIICSVIGDDDDGNLLKDMLIKKDIIIDHIIVSNNRKTTNKTRIIGNNCQITRFDEEMTTELCEDDFLSVIHNIEFIIENNNIDVILLQDYDKGVLNKKLIDKVIKKSSIPIIVDPKKRNFNFYKNIKLIKPNFKEFKEGLDIYNNVDIKEILKIGAKKLHKKGVEIVFVTLSENGIFVSYDYGEKSELIPGIKRNITDVSGAGDTVISVISTLINKDVDILKMSKISNVAGGVVCEYSGVVPINLEKLKEDTFEEYGYENLW